MPVGGITRVQLPKAGSEGSSSGGSVMPVDPGRGISQLSSSSTGSHPPACGPHQREPEVSTNTRRGISPLSPSGFSSSVRTYRPPSSQHDIPRPSPSNTDSAGSSNRPPPRHSNDPARRSPPPSLLDTPVPGLHSPGSLDILLSAHLVTSQLSQSTNSPPLGNYRPPPPPNTTSMGPSYRLPPGHSYGPALRSPPPSLLDAPVPSSLSPRSLDIPLPTHGDTPPLSQLTDSLTLGSYGLPPPRPVPAPRCSPSEAPSSSSEPRGMATPTLTRETQLPFATPAPQASSQSLQPSPPPRGIFQLSPSLQPTPRAPYRNTSFPFPGHIPWAIAHQMSPHEILDSLHPVVLPLITALVDSRRSHVIPLHNLSICLENHLCVPNLIDLRWDPVAPLGSSSVKELQSGVNKMLKGFSIVINLKLRVEMGERGTRTILRVLMNEDEESLGGDGWLATEGAGWEDLERIEVGIMFPQETQAG